MINYAQFIARLIAAKVYRRTNILGTVSQTGGVPTGAIVQTGSNANGTYTKYADGTMICRHLTAQVSYPTASTLYTWTFPVVFVGTPAAIIFPVAGNSATHRFGMEGLAQNTAQGFLHNNGVAINISMSCIAVGRWF